MRLVAAILSTTILASCATTSGEGRGDHEMAVLAEGALFVGGAAAATYGCVDTWDACRHDAPYAGAVLGGTLAFLLAMSYGFSAYNHYHDKTYDVHVEATPRAGYVALAFTVERDPEVGEKDYLGMVLIDPATGAADLTARRYERVCVAYAKAIDAPFEEVHCARARPHLQFAAAR